MFLDWHLNYQQESVPIKSINFDWLHQYTNDRNLAIQSKDNNSLKDNITFTHQVNKLNSARLAINSQ
jgi:hypothetical protein